MRGAVPIDKNDAVAYSARGTCLPMPLNKAAQRSHRQTNDLGGSDVRAGEMAHSDQTSRRDVVKEARRMNKDGRSRFSLAVAPSSVHLECCLLADKRQHPLATLYRMRWVQWGLAIMDSG